VLTAAYSGDASFNPSQSAPFTFTIVKAPTSSVLQSNTGSVSAGSTVTLAAQINALGFAANGLGGFGLAAPGGTVTFTSAGISLGNAAVTQNAYPAFTADYGLVSFTFPASQLSIGNNTITASYSGDANYQPSTFPPVSVYVTSSALGMSDTTLSLSNASVAEGDLYSFTAAVSPNNPLPTGTVVFLSDGQAVSKPMPLSSGTVSVSSQLVMIAPGVHLISALYSGDSTYQASVSAPAPFAVSTATVPSIATITVSPAAVEKGTGVTVTTTLSPTSPVPGGSAQVLLDGNLYGQPVPLTGASTTLPLLTSTLQSGIHVLQVNYSGDRNRPASTSSAATLTILDSTGGFTLSPSTTSTTMALGRSSSAVTLTIAPEGGFHSTITFACTEGLPTGATCLFNPASITPTDSALATTALTISSTAMADRVVEPTTSRGLVPVLGAVCAGMIAFMLPGGNTRRWRALTLLVVLTTLGLLSGCGSGGVDPNAASPLSTGSYAVTVRATGGSTIQTATINFTVQ
jgi:Bacterial Ig-like domain (group 3)